MPESELRDAQDQEVTRQTRELHAPSPPATLTPAARPPLRASDADRHRVVADLQGHFIDGRLTDAELGERISQAFAARTLVELDALVLDLPAVPAPVAPATSVARSMSASSEDVDERRREYRRRRRHSRAHVGRFLPVMAIIVGVWFFAMAAGGFHGHFFFFPMVFWIVPMAVRTIGRSTRAHDDDSGAESRFLLR